MAKGGKGAVVFGVEVGTGGGLQEPGAAVVVSHVTGEAGEAEGVEPFEVVGEPLLDGCEVGVGEGFGGGEEGDGLSDLGEVYGFDNAFGTAGFCRRDDLSVEEARGHAGFWVDEPCVKVGDCLVGVLGVLGDDEGRGERGNVKAEVEESVAVGGEGVGVGLPAALGVGAGGIGYAGPVVFGFGVEVVRCAGASW